MPGITTPCIKLCTTHTFEFTLRHAGTDWYHSHTELQEQRGVYGGIVVAPRGGEKVRAFLQKRSFTFRHLVGAQAYCNQFTSSYPLSIFVDRQGVVRDIVEGMSPLTGGLGAKAVDDREFNVALKLIK